MVDPQEVNHLANFTMNALLQLFADISGGEELGRERMRQVIDSYLVAANPRYNQARILRDFLDTYGGPINWKPSWDRQR